MNCYGKTSIIWKIRLSLTCRKRPLVSEGCNGVMVIVWVWYQWSSLIFLWRHPEHIGSANSIDLEKLNKQPNCHVNTDVSSCFLWLSLQLSPPPPPPQASSYKHHSTAFHSRPLAPLFWNTLPEAPYPFLWLPSICWGCMPHGCNSHGSLLISWPSYPTADWTPFEKHAQNQTSQNLLLLSDSRGYHLPSYWYSSQVLKPHNWASPLILAPVPSSQPSQSLQLNTLNIAKFCFSSSPLVPLSFQTHWPLS